MKPSRRPRTAISLAGVSLTPFCPLPSLHAIPQSRDREILAHRRRHARLDTRQALREEALKRKVWPAAIIAAAMVLLSTGGHAADNVKIGILWPLTGNAAAAGQASKAAAELAAEIVNNAHPDMANLPLAATAGLPNLGGAKLELVFADHQGNPSGAQSQALRLVT